MHSGEDRKSLKINNCFVLLQPLDKKILDKYLKKKEVNSETSDCESTPNHHAERADHRTHLFESYSKNYRSSKDVCVNSKQGIADKTESLTRKEKLSLSLRAHCAASVEFFNSQISKNDVSSNVKSNEKENIKRSKQNSISDETQSEGEKQKTGELRSEVILGNTLEDPFYTNKKKNFQEPEEFSQRNTINLTDKKEFVENSNNSNEIFSDTVESEVEIILENIKPNNFQNKFFGQSNMHIVQAKAKSTAVPNQKVEDEECDLREEDEDDTATVIFEKSIGCSTDFEKVFEKNKRNIKKKFKITNRKKETLVKFKRKRNTVGRILAKINKCKKKFFKTSGHVQQLSKNSTNAVNETEFSRLVKRLYESYRIILQQQKDSPKSIEQANYIIKTINTQQENFVQDIKKSQKTIIHGYEKMLNTNGNADKAYLEIGKSTSLSTEDISNVISQCTLAKGITEKRKTEEKDSISTSQEIFPGLLGSEKYSKKIKKHINDKTEAELHPEAIEESNEAFLEKTIKDNSSKTLEPKPNCVSPIISVFSPSPFHSSGSRKTLLPTPPLEPQITGEIRCRENNLMTNLPFKHSFRANSPLSVNYRKQWFDHSKSRPHFWPKKNYIPKPYSVVRDPKRKQFPPQNLTRNNSHTHHVKLPPLRTAHCQLKIRAQYRGDAFNFHSSRPKVANNRHSDINGYFQNSITSGRGMRLPIPALMDLNPFPNHVRLPVNQFHQISKPRCSASTAVRPLVQIFDNPGRSNMPSHNFKISKSLNFSTKVPNNSQKPYAVSSPIRIEYTAASALKEENHFLKSTSMNFDKCSQPNSESLNYATQSGAVSGNFTNPTEMNMNTDSLKQNPTNESDVEKPESCDLDPTVPQKLTMKNCRLQAGATLEAKTKNFDSESIENKTWVQPILEETLLKNDIESDNLNDSDSRVYVCAQNYCTNSGVRICNGCLSIIYCSETCQLKHWAVKHKTECHQLKELRG